MQTGEDETGMQIRMSEREERDRVSEREREGDMSQREGERYLRFRYERREGGRPIEKRERKRGRFGGRRLGVRRLGGSKIGFKIWRVSEIKRERKKEGFQYGFEEDGKKEGVLKKKTPFFHYWASKFIQLARRRYTI